jgi:hypothetical protein
MDEEKGMKKPKRRERRWWPDERNPLLLADWLNSYLIT